MDIPQLLHRLRTDNTSGASTLLELAIDILEAFAAQAPEHNPQDFRQVLEALIQALITAQPSMAPLVNLAHAALQACPEGLAPTAARQQLRQTMTAFRQHTRQSTAALCQQALTVLPAQAVVLTYSNSATVIAALHHAHRHGHLRRVFLSESRPAYDGRLQAAALLAHGIAVDYSIDMALFERLPEAQVVLLGADAVFPHGLVNKLGTHPLAQMARFHHVPVFSLCTSAKFLPAAAASLVRFADHPGQEVWPEAPPEVRIRNRYFDLTPLPLFSGIISEHGVYAPAALRAHLQCRELSPTLLRLASYLASGNDHSVLPTDRAFLQGLEER
jgi:translation initiation factor 2B subunit (eIF-2B alpha/beta/delta family)